MKLRKVFALAVLGLLIFTCSAMAVPTENALSPQPDESVYIVMKLSNTGNLLRWALSQEHIDALMPLILSSESSNEIIGGIEITSSIINKLPIESLAFCAGVTKSEMPFMQAAFTLSPELGQTFKKIKAGNADARDIAKLILGNDSALASVAESMIKVERDDDKYVIDNEMILKAEGDMLLLSISPEEVDKSVKALNDPEERLFTKVARKFPNRDDFVILHVDHEVAKKLDEDDTLEDVNLEKYLDKPLNIELAFERLPGKFLASLGVNLREALKPKYIERYFKASELVTSKGGYIDLNSAGGKTSPIIALGGLLQPTAITETKELRSFWTDTVKALKRFNITESELSDILTGSVSLVINDSVTIEGFKVPAIFMSATGIKGTAGKIFEKLAKSQHLSRLQENILQVDSSLSPVSCLVINNGDTLGISIADSMSFNEKPSPSGALASVMARDAVSALVIDFAGIQSWINDNGIFMFVMPLATMAGYGKIAEQVRDILNAKFSVPSVAIWAESPEIIHSEYAIDESVRPEDGLLVKLVKIAREYMPKPKPKPEEAPAE